MGAHLGRREFLALAGAAGLVLAACSSKGSGGDSAPKSATVKHIFGETTVPAPPKRVVSAGFTEQDDLLALGVVPIAVTNWFGDQPFGVWPWAQPKLGSAQPVVLNLDNGIQIDRIATLKPDLIVAVNAGLDADTYKKLSAIAPTIAQSGGDAFFEPWKDQAGTIAQAVFHADHMTQLIREVDDKFSTAGKNNSSFKDKKALLLSGSFFGDTLTATLPGWRTEFLSQMGFTIPDSITSFAADDHRAMIPRATAGLGPRFRRRTDLVDRERRRTGPTARRPGRCRSSCQQAEPQRLHHQGPRRNDRLRLATVLPAGGGSAAPAAVPRAGLTARAWMTP